MPDPHRPADRLDLLDLLRRRAWLAVVCAVAVAALAYLVSNRQQSRYESTALLSVVSDNGPTLPGREVNPQSSASTENAVPIVGTRDVAARAAQRANLSGSGASVGATRLANSTLVRVTATATQPQVAAALANAFAIEYRRKRQTQERATLRRAKRSIQQTLDGLPDAPAGRERRVALGQRIDDLQLQIDLNQGGLELAERAVPPAEAESPKPRRDAGLGGLFGLVLGGALALLWARSDHRLRQVSQLQDVSGLPVLGTIPSSRALSSKASATLEPDDAEAFRVVQANSRFFDPGHDVRSIIVTSAGPEEGKSTLAWNLAVAAATGGQRVLLIEADLRRPSLARRHGLEDNGGLVELLSEDREIEDVAQHVSVDAAGNGHQPTADLQVVTAGRNPANPSGLIASDRMRGVIARAEADYDLVVLDTPPVAVISDAIPLLREVGGVIVVSYLGRSTREGMDALLTQLRHLDVRVLGLVVNGAPRSDAYAYP